jgi:hypothetical protein
MNFANGPHINISSIDQELMFFIQFQSAFSWTFLMAYSKAKVKRNGDKASPFPDRSE